MKKHTFAAAQIVTSHPEAFGADEVIDAAITVMESPERTFFDVQQAGEAIAEAVEIHFLQTRQPVMVELADGFVFAIMPKPKLN
jgi:hypothetical protein